MTEEVKEEAENPFIERAEEILRFIDGGTQTFVMVFFDYDAGDLEIVSNANTAEEVMTLLMEGANLAKENCLEENKPEWPIDNKFH